MTSFQSVLYAYLARLPRFFGFMPILLISFFYFGFELSFYTLLYILPFTVFFLIGQVNFVTRTKVLLSVVAFLIFGIVIFSVTYFAHFALSVFLIGALAFLAISGTHYEYARDVFAFAIFINVALAIFFILHHGDFATLALPQQLVNTTLAAIAAVLCKFYHGLDIIAHSRTFRHQPKESAQRFMQHKHKLFLTVFGVAIGFVLFYSIWGFDVEMNLEPSSAIDERLRERDDALGVLQLEEEGFSGEVFDLEDMLEREPEEVQDMEEALGLITLVETLLIVLVIIIGIMLSKTMRRLRRIKTAMYTDEKIEDELLMISPKAGHKGSENLSTNRQIRRAFKKKVNGHRRQGLFIKQDYTPERISDKIKPKENIESLTNLYCQARYGKDKIPQAALAQLKRKAEEN